MQVKFDIIAIITFIGLSVILYFIMVMLTNKKGNFRANLFFTLLLICLSLVICDSGIILYSNLYYYIPHFVKIPTLTQLLYGPLFLFYLKTLLRNEPIRAGSLALHIIPFVIYTILYSPILFQGSEYKIMYVYSWLNDTVSKPALIRETILFAIILIINLSYLLYSLRYIRIYEQDSKKLYSNIKSDLSWIRHFVVFVMIIIVCVMILFIPVLVFGFKFKIAYRFVPILSTIAFCILAYRAAKQSEIGFGHDISSSNKYVEPLLRESEIETVVKNILVTMEQEKLFQRVDLTLPDLAKRIGVTRNQMSYIINSYFRESFFDFVNRFRVEEAKKLIERTNNTNLLNLGLNVGFNSKTSFNVNFRKFTKMSPSEYRKNRGGTSRGEIRRHP